MAEEIETIAPAAEPTPEVPVAVPDANAAIVPPVVTPTPPPAPKVAAKPQSGGCGCSRATREGARK